jgi:hypothetical protein
MDIFQPGERMNSQEKGRKMISPKKFEGGYG